MGDKVHLLGDYQRQQYDYPEQDENYEGRHLDRDLKHGPLESRGCRDILFVLLFLGTWALMIFCGMRAFDGGDVSLIYSPFDTAKNQCGKGDAAKYKNVYMVSPKEFYCVKFCPNQAGDQVDGYIKGTFSAPYASTKLVTFCFPTVSDWEQYIGTALDIAGFQKHYADLEQTWPLILGCAGFAFIISIILTFVIRFTASCIVWGMLVIYLATVAGIGGIAYYQINGNELNEYRFTDDKKTLEIIAYTCWSIAGLSFLIFLCLAKKIHQAIQVLKTAADFTRDTWTAIFVPVVTLLMITGFFAYWVYFSALIYSTATDSVKPSDLHPYIDLEWNAQTGWQLCVYFFALVWNICFSIALCQFVISSACCMWYYSHKGYDTSNSIIKGFCRGFTTSFGSLLFGSLILAIVWIIQFVLELVHRNLRQHVVGDNAQLNCFFRCIKCCVSYFERFIRFLNQNAYTMIALTGQGFCDAAYDAFYLISRNVIRVAITHGLGQMFEFIGTLFVAASSTMCCYLILVNTSMQENVTTLFAPTAAFIIVGYVIGRMFMNIYGMGVDTIIMCYLVDHELHKHEGGPQSAPQGLKQYMSEHQ